MTLPAAAGVGSVLGARPRPPETAWTVAATALAPFAARPMSYNHLRTGNPTAAPVRTAPCACKRSDEPFEWGGRCQPVDPLIGPSHHGPFRKPPTGSTCGGLP